ncbi:MAG: hypothetical protein HXX16_00225 [Bacteroidales bacterium]|nr:hypothetical protein [Bacteroidales bacterium]
MKHNALVFGLIFFIGFSTFYSCKKEDSFVNTPPTIENQQFSLNENTPNGVMVDTVKATDIDKNQKLKYSIISGNFDAAFRIDSLTGMIYVNNSLALDYEKVTIFELGVRVKDDYKNPLTASAKITITINNIIEIPIPQNGLVAYYPFNGNANDESGNSHNGIVYGASLTTDRHHKANSAYEFNGVNNFINTFSTFDYEYRTISLWVFAYNMQGLSPNNHAIIAQDDPSLSYGILAASYDNGVLKVNAGGSSASDIFQTNQIAENRWYHLVIVRDGVITKYYINGDLKYSGTSGTLTSSSGSNQLLIGVGRSKTLQFFSGKIDDLAIYNRVLSPSEINTMYAVK